MAEERVIAVDLAALAREDGELKAVLAWGDPVTVVDEEPQRLRVTYTDHVEKPDGSIEPTQAFGFIRRRIKLNGGNADVAVPAAQGPRVLKVDFVDVQQGDGTLIETPAGRVITVDGGDNQLFARFLANRFRGTSAQEPQPIDAMVVSHGDADHFEGLAEIHISETLEQQRKRLFVAPRRVYHNGLVKRPDTKERKEGDLLGPTKKVGDETIVTGLEDNLLDVPLTEMNAPFKRWRKALEAWQARSPIEFRRLTKGDDDAFGFLADEDIDVRVLGPILTTAGGVTGLRFLGKPREGPGIGHVEPTEFGGLSASHTINGHSIVLRLAFGSWRLLLAGDLNAQVEQDLTAEHNLGTSDLRSEVLKVPHHGSADFSHAFLKAVSPVVSVVSSGDELKPSDYIHPRATLVNSLGRHGRDGAGPVVFVTEMVAFFKAVGWLTPKDSQRSFFAFKRTAFGLVRVRTDGNRLLVFTNSGLRDLKEAYAFATTPAGEVVPAGVRQAKRPAKS